MEEPVLLLTYPFNWQIISRCSKTTKSSTAVEEVLKTRHFAGGGILRRKMSGLMRQGKEYIAYFHPSFNPYSSPSFFLSFMLFFLQPFHTSNIPLFPQLKLFPCFLFSFLQLFLLSFLPIFLFFSFKSFQPSYLIFFLPSFNPSFLCFYFPTVFLFQSFALPLLNTSFLTSTPPFLSLSLLPATLPPVLYS